MDFLTDVLGSDAVMNSILALVGVVLTFLINRAVAAFTLATGISIQEKHRIAIHSALITGVESMLHKGPEVGIDMIRKSAVDYAQRSVPDAILALVPGDGVLDRIAERYIIARLPFGMSSDRPA